MSLRPGPAHTDLHVERYAQLGRVDRAFQAIGLSVLAQLVQDRLEKIAEESEVDATPEDYDEEIRLISEQSDMPERRVRARLEKQGQMDALRNQIVERKVIEMVVEAAKVKEEKVEKNAGEDDSEFAVYHSVLATKEEDAIPEAKYEDNTPKGAEKEKDA